MTDSSAPSVCAIVVTYRPDVTALRALVRAVTDQVAAVVVVDNGGAEWAGDDIGEQAVVLRQGSNLGLAAAQNVGIDWARRHRHTHVLLLDQDSEPAPDMVTALLGALGRLDRRVAAVGPEFRDDREAAAAPFVRVRFPVSRKIWCDASTRLVRADFLIGSGTLAPMAVLDDVGTMDEALFIDSVDLEWSFRARALGYELYGVCDARMSHRLGDARRPVLGGRLQFTTHPPVRLYFIMRNRLALYRLPHTPRAWIAQDVIRIPVKFFLFAALSGPRRRNCAAMVRGLLDGLRGVGGPAPRWVSR